MDPVTAMLIAAGISGASQIGQTVMGAIQARKAQKQINAWRPPEYTRPREYSQLMALLGRRATSEMPGLSQMYANIGAYTAAQNRAIQSYADSPVSALGASSSLYSSYLNNIRDLGIRSALYRAQREAELARGLQQGAEYSDKEYYYNKFYPDQVKMNILASRYKAGLGGMYGGISGLGQTAMGTMGNIGQYEAYRLMYPQYPVDEYGRPREDMGYAPMMGVPTQAVDTTKLMGL